MLKHRKKSACGGKSIEFILGQSNLFICTCIRGLFKVKELGKNVFYSHQKNEYLGKYAEFGVFILGNLKLFFIFSLTHFSHFLFFFKIFFGTVVEFYCVSITKRVINLTVLEPKEVLIVSPVHLLHIMM